MDLGCHLPQEVMWLGPLAMSPGHIASHCNLHPCFWVE